jgi:ribosomal protein L14E/L6E/L27E
LDIQAGNLVFSIAGRDSGRVFIVLKVEDGFCYLADGRLRKVSKPKKKKTKHVKPTLVTAESLKDKITLDERLTNTEIRNCIRDLMEDVDV